MTFCGFIKDYVDFMSSIGSPGYNRILQFSSYHLQLLLISPLLIYYVLAHFTASLTAANNIIGQLKFPFFLLDAGLARPTGRPVGIE